jgi:hypothetical protein
VCGGSSRTKRRNFPDTINSITQIGNRSCLVVAFQREIQDDKRPPARKFIHKVRVIEIRPTFDRYVLKSGSVGSECSDSHCSGY